LSCSAPPSRLKITAADIPVLRFAFPALFSSPAAKAADEIKIASTGPGVSNLPLEIASRKGFFSR
jgi:hypothetical protein